ncbi:MAG: TetR family transcriptional regulator [Deltaproteobacteria bacterium]|nr:MAG: TetR family transcriptional regulator [Deltaproteobacteria bacterium]PIE73590.1 MAG: TetR family transcriptional regulator [Deltaproteobacteria bacterium]
MKADNKHSKIITAATKVFAKKGFFTARISDIAKEAKVADGTIYLYFNNKNDILLSVFEEEVGKILHNTRKLLEKETCPERMLEVFVRQHLQAMKKNRYLAEVIQTELRQTSKIIKTYRNNKFSEYTGIISEIIIKGQQEKRYNPEIKPEVAQRIIFGALDEVSRVWNNSMESHYSVEELTLQTLTLVQNGLLQT